MNELYFDRTCALLPEFIVVQMSQESPSQLIDVVLCDQLGYMSQNHIRVFRNETCHLQSWCSSSSDAPHPPDKLGRNKSS